MSKILNLVMYNRKSFKVINESNDDIDGINTKLKSILKSREVKSSTTPRNDYVYESLGMSVKIGRSELINNLPKTAKSCTLPKASTRPDSSSTSVLDESSSLKQSTSSERSTISTIKSPRNKISKKRRKKPIAKKTVKAKVEENEFQEKLHCVQNRIYVQIIEIKRGLYEPIILPDGKEDLVRRKKLENEFWCRFTRNFVSEFVRQMRIFLRLAQTKPKTINAVKLAQRRLLTLHQIVFQSLSSYIGHMPMSMTNDLNTNVRFVLEQLLSVLKMCTDCKICNSISKIQNGVSTLLTFQEEDKETLKLQYKEMKPLQSSRREQHKLTKRLSMYLDRPGQYKLLSKSLRKSLKSKILRKGCNRLVTDPNGPLIIDPDVETQISLEDTSSSDEDEDTRLQMAYFNMGNLISTAIDYKNTLKSVMSVFPKYFTSGGKSWNLVSVLTVQLINEAIIDMTTWDTEQVLDEFAPLD